MKENEEKVACLLQERLTLPSVETLETESQDKMRREIAQLAFRNPGPSTQDVLGFNPEYSNREKRKLDRLLDDKRQNRSKQLTGYRKASLYAETGILIASGEDVCDCMTADCAGCFYPCPKCSSTKCASSCRCNRNWRYQHPFYES